MLDPAIRANPYPVYDEIRTAGPLAIPEANLVVFGRWADCDAVLRHPHAASDRMKSTAARRMVERGEEVRPLGQPGFLFLDPPDHTRLRRLVSKAFVPKVVQGLEADIVAMVDGLLDEALDDATSRGGVDVVADLAYPLPVAVICRLLGVPLEDEPQFRDSSALLAQGLDPFVAVSGATPDGFEERLAAGLWLRDYLRGLIERRRAEPRDDLISGLIAAEEEGDALTVEEIVATCNLLLIAGHETTVNLIANAALAMLRDPRQWTLLARDPGRASAVIEETMRVDPPVQLVGRVAAADMEIGGDGGSTVVPAGDTIMLLLAAAHRDPAVFDRPGEFDPDRPTIRHLGFGKGPHFCLGAPLARLEASVALGALTRRLPDARIAGEPRYKANVTLRGLAELRLG